MKTEQQLQLQAYLDNELSPGDARKIASLISSDPEAQALYRELKDTKEIVSANEMPLKLQESRDFYWSQIKRQIEAGEKSAEARPRSSWLLRWVAPMAGACAVLALALSLANFNQQPQVTVNVPVAQPAPAPVAQASPVTLKQLEGADVSTITFRSESEGMTVVWISNDI